MDGFPKNRYVFIDEIEDVSLGGSVEKLDRRWILDLREAEESDLGSEAVSDAREASA